jgi:hypothetical protein|tara:strand:+ start:9584 stop:15196 length:5613 start_codon:yes stop_codon:yes gene_type:complete
MEEIDNIIINQVDPTTFEYQQYTEQDNILISSSRLDTTFSSSIDYIEYYVYGEDKNLIFPTEGVYNNKNYKVVNGDVIIYPSKDLENLGYDQGSFFSTYNFYRKRLGSDININYYIDQISSDRTEIRLKSNTIESGVIISSSLDFISYREEAEYFVDFYLNFGADQQVICNNINLDQTDPVNVSVLVKLYEPLPINFSLKDTLWVVEEIASSQAYNVVFPEVEFIPDDFQLIKGPNYSIQVTQQTGEASQEFSFNTLMQTDVTSSSQQLRNVLDRKEINISVDYTKYDNFVYFSSALTRLENFYTKVGMIQSSSAEIVNLPVNSATYSSSKAGLTTSISTLIANFDGWEYFMYYNSGSDKSYPKSTTAPPYILEPTQSAVVLDWLGSADPNNALYGGQAFSSSNYDVNNDNYLYNAIPEYLRDDSDNAKYILFVDMVAQQYDNTWLYTKNITTRFDADNRLDFGISKDLVADAIRDFGVKLYSNNFNTNDLYTSFLGLTPSGSAFPFPEMTGSFPTPSGFEYVNTEVSASNDIVPLDNVNKSLYKRIYHNLPYLLKTKGTTSGLRALITSYGVPDTILRINEFGGKDRDDFQDWDYSENVFNYALHLDGETSQITSSFQTNPNWSNAEDAPRSIQFRFKTPGIPTSSAYYNLAVADTSTWAITLEYTGSGMDSGSYSGSVPSQSNAYGTLKFWPDGGTDINATCSIDLPYFDGGWWSVMATVDYDELNTGSLFVANRIGEKIGFSGSDSVGATSQYFQSAETAFFPSASGLVLNSLTYTPITGALQEVRYWDIPLSESLFYDYVVNPYSTQGNTINETPDMLVFRADLGTQLNTGSRTSIHPKVTGSWITTSSFAGDDSSFFISGSFIQNTENIYLNQVPGGIKNRISDKIKIDQEVLPTGSTLSPYRSIQQSTFPSGSSPSINYLEVAFSPTDQVNDDIIAQIGAFNLGDYIGDPRQISESGATYPALDKLRDAYFTKYIDSYDVNDFIRLVKFFDNSLFKMIEDFTPARTTLSSGVVIKQNLLERNRQAPPSMSYTTPEYSGSVKSFARDYQVPNSSTSYPQDSTISGSSIQLFSGGTGGVFEPYNSIFAAPISGSTQETCLLGYFFTSSTELLDPNANVGETVFNANVGNSTNTMSINVEGISGQNYTDFLRLVHTASINEEAFVTVSSGSLSISHQIDKTMYFDGYSVDEYGVAPYGDYTNMFEFYLTVTENPQGLNNPFINLDEIDICFTLGVGAYSGKTASEVSASSVWQQFPDYQQSWTESVVPSLGITPAYNTQNTSSNNLPPVIINRIDQREFYNGEFGGAIPVGMNEICDAFFGQDAIIDYFFRIQWFNANNFSEENFLTSSALPLAGNVWMWTDTSGSSFTGLTNGEPLSISQQPYSTYPTPLLNSQGSPALTASLSPTSFTGVGSGITLGVTQSFVGAGPLVAMEVYIESTGSGYTAGDQLTFSTTDLTAAGFIKPVVDTDLIVDIQAGDILFITSSESNKVKYIKMSNSDINGVSILPFIQDSEYVTFNLTGAQDYLGNLIEGYQTWFISNVSVQDDNNASTEDATLIIVNQEPSSDAINSYDSAFYDLSFSASGVYSYYSTASGEDPNVIPSIGITQSVAQGYFPPISTFPTESFFRGWAKSNYFQSNTDGTVYRVETGSGFSSDNLGNFNTGSVEMDFDPSVPYTSSKIPWFMNAVASTTQILDNSSLVGDLTTNTLQMYTGSITASAVPIGPSFEILGLPTPIPSTNTIFSLAPASNFGTFVISCGVGMTSYSQINYAPTFVQLTFSNPTEPWTAFVTYADSYNWVTLSAQSGTGNSTISVTVSNDPNYNIGSSPLTTRTATLTILTLATPGQLNECTIQQTVYDQYGWSGGIP